MTEHAKLTEKERKVLVALSGPGEGYALNFSGLKIKAGLQRDDARDACRSLAAKGLAQFMRGLFCEFECTTAGSGYGITRSGMELAATFTPDAEGQCGEVD